MIVVSDNVDDLTSTSNEDVNKLTVDFSFMSKIKKVDAIAQIDKLVSLADDNADIKLIDHNPTFWEKSQWYDADEEAE